MTGLKILVLAGAAGLLFAATPSRAMAQISVSVGAAPDCPYGYYDSAPYGCAPDGYYGPEWFAAASLSVLAHGSTAPTTSRAK
jgi:hypothetical protein